MINMRTIFAAALLLGGVGALMCGNHTAARANSPQPNWDEVPWPFPMDEWGQGKAFACKAAECGADVTVYIRAKIGFCNCTSGIAEDEELDRISDFSLFESKLHALAAGRPIAVAWMKGRSRAFAILDNPRAAKSALSVGFNDRCDAIVATALVAGEHPEQVEEAVLGFLNSRTVLRWAEGMLGL